MIRLIKKLIQQLKTANRLLADGFSCIVSQQDATITENTTVSKNAMLTGYCDQLTAHGFIFSCCNGSFMADLDTLFKNRR